MLSILLALVVGAGAFDARTRTPKTPKKTGPDGRIGGVIGTGGVPQGTLGAAPGAPTLKAGAAPSAEVHALGGALFGTPTPEARAAMLNPDGSMKRAPGTDISVMAAPELRGVLTPQNQLQQIGAELGESRKAEAVGGEGAVSQTLDKVFDAAKRSAAGGAAAVAGRVTEAAQKVKQLVAVGNNAAPRDAPKLYAEAIQVAGKALPAEAAAVAAAAIRRSADGKARLSLGALANAAYEHAAAGRSRELEQELKGLEQWSALLSSPEAPLIANKERLVSDIRRVAGERAPAPRVFFRPREQGGYDAVLPLSSVAPLPARLITAVSVAEQPELGGPDAVIEAGLAELKNGGSGAGALYKAARRMGASVPSAALASASFSLKSLLFSLRDWLLDLVGLGPSSLARGGAVVTNTPLDAKALEPYRLYGKLADLEASLAWRLSAPSVDLGVLSDARAAAVLHEKITGDKTGRLAVETLAVRLERRREFPEPDARALARWLTRLRDDALRATVKAKPVLGSNVKIGGRWAAAQGAEGAAASSAQRLLAAAPALSDVSLVLDGPRLWLSRPGFKAFVDARGTDEGGRLELAAEGDFEAAWAAAGLSTERRGKLTLGWLDGERAAAGAAELTEALIEAIGAGSGPAAVSDLWRVAGKLQEPQAAALAAVVRDNDPSPLSYSVIGEVHGQPALQSRRGALSITVLRDPLTGEPSRAFAEAGGKPLAPAALRGLLRPQ